MAPETRARKRLSEWMALDEKVRTRSAVALALGMSQPSVSCWVLGDSRPEPHMRDAIEVLTDGYVRAQDWMTSKEAKLAGSLRPMRRTGSDSS